tara:strand:- start:1420 stop:2199 length:780 start_codon:yes stop_codon:yes gene_type:complete
MTTLFKYLITPLLSTYPYYLGYVDVKLKYRRSLFGPWWLTISTLIFIIMLSFLWSKVFSYESDDFLLYFSIGFIIWLWISNQLIEASNGYGPYQGIIKQIKVNPILFTLRMNIKNFILFLHNSIVILIILIYLNREINLVSLFLFFLGVLYVQLNLFLLTIIIMFLCSRFQDLTQVVLIANQLFFFVTPIIWQIDSLKSSMFILDLNPFYYWVEIIRGSIINGVMDVDIFLKSLIILSLLLFIYIFITKRFHKKIAMWI